MSTPCLSGTVCFHQGCLLFSQLALFSCQVRLFLPDSLSLVVALFYLSASVWHTRSCLPTIPQGWPLTSHLSCKIFTRHFSRLPGEFFSLFLTRTPSPALTQYLRLLLVAPRSGVVSIFWLPLTPLILPLYILAASLLTLQPCLLIVPSPPTFAHLLFSVLSPLSVVSTFSSSHSFSSPLLPHLTSNFPRRTPTCHPPQSASGTHISIPLLSAASMPLFFLSFAPFLHHPRSH